MKKGLAFIALATITISIIGTTEAPALVTVQPDRPVPVVWLKGKVERLQARRDALHRYIHHLRREAAQAQAAVPAPTPTPTPTPAPVVSEPTSSYTGGVLSASEVAAYARAAGFPESAIPTMVAYAYRESRFNPRAINASSGACGLWQLYPCIGGSAWLDPATNAHFAYEKYQAAGFSPWAG